MKRSAIAAGLAAVTATVLLTGCGNLKSDDDCRTPQPVVMFFGTDGHYHYGSPKGRIVPAVSVPSSARKVPGYKAPSPKVAPPPKVDMKKPGVKIDTPKPAPAPAPKPRVPVSTGPKVR